MDVDIMDHGTHRVHDEDYGLTNSPTHTVFSPEPHSPTVTEVLPDTSRQSDESVSASPSTSDADEPTTTANLETDPPAAETEAEAEHNTNAPPEAETSTNANAEASKDGSEDK